MKYSTKSLDNIDINNAFFHYTNISNLDSIFKSGLEPKVGENSKGIEINKKVFFSIGYKGVLVLMDAWIKWLILRPKSNFIYETGSYLMTKKYFPKIIVDTIFSVWIKSHSRKSKAIKKLNKILNESVFLVLDLKEQVDFSYNDIDEVKNQNYSRKQLSYVYSYTDDINISKQEYWNMHTFFNKKIEIEKISILEIEDNYCANNIIKKFVEIDIEFVKFKLPFLYDYYNVVFND